MNNARYSLPRERFAPDKLALVTQRYDALSKDITFFASDCAIGYEVSRESIGACRDTLDAEAGP